MARGRSKRGGRKTGISSYKSRTQSRPGLTVATQNNGINFGKISRKMGTAPKIHRQTKGNKTWRSRTSTRRPHFATPIKLTVKANGNASTQNARRGY